MPRKGKYVEWLSEDALLTIRGWARDGFTDEQIAQNIGISNSTMSEWKNRFSAFRDALKKGRQPVMVEIEDAIYHRAKGYTAEETTLEVTEQKDAEGKIIGSTVHKKTIKKHIPADTTALIFLLKCQKKDKFNDKKSADDW